MKAVNLKNIYPIDSTFNNVSFIDENEINTCLEHDEFSRLINKILRMLRQDDQTKFELLENLLITMCN